jgi:RHH-type proline utilization regulon transcriptional repressor/proline dehydrogenase/delta 1-pyrroline-5-carboxylate dehydrogenase
VNRGITGAIVQRQPFGGWKKSAVGAGTKAGGPNYLVGLGSWTSAESAATAPLGENARKIINAASSISAEEQAFLTRSLHSDAAAWASEFGTAKDVSGLSAERNVFRYLPLNPLVRLAEGEPVAKLLRVLAAGITAGATPEVSSGVELPHAVRALLVSLRITVTVENDADWLAHARRFGAGRIRLIGGDAAAVYQATGGRPDLAIYHNEVTEAGRIEMLPFMHEQAVSITAHRFGTPNHLSDGLI